MHSRLSTEFIAEVLGLKVSAPAGPFLPVDLGNGVTLDYYDAGPRLTDASQLNHLCGGRGAHFTDPEDPTMEIITRPYIRRQLPLGASAGAIPAERLRASSRAGAGEEARRAVTELDRPSEEGM
ncbi:hypothetical protein GCM10009665_27220 [Kitasatospora nipponensis]|uniref:Uncharacterized protein n=1 Tax=Kitasatospora nipponensis TaxID=258049 RepID=A0ABN1W706_9ACTN